MATDSPTVEFWRWFVANSSRLANDYDQPDIVTALDRRVQALNPDLSWEIGPGTSKQFQLVISPDLNPALREISLQIVRLAPELADWEFYASRPPKQWSLQFQLDRENGEGSEIDAAGWTFVLQKTPSARYDVLLVAEELQPLTEENVGLPLPSSSRAFLVKTCCSTRLTGSGWSMPFRLLSPRRSGQFKN